MDENFFSKAVEKQLVNLYEVIDDLCETLDLDIDFTGDILYVNTSYGQFVINKHTPTRQIWVSSPKSGASYFSFDELKNNWVNNQGEFLIDKISNEIKN